MGYDTYWGGEISITPPLTAEEHQTLTRILCPEFEQKHKRDVFAEPLPQLTREDAAMQEAIVNFPFDLLTDQISADDHETRYYAYQAEEDLKLIAVWMQQHGHELQGDLYYNSSEDDKGIIYAAFIAGVNRTERVGADTDVDPPSWAKDAHVVLQAAALAGKPVSTTINQ